MAQAKGAVAPAKAAEAQAPVDQAPVDQAPVGRVTVIAQITINDGATSTAPGEEVTLSAEDAARLIQRGHAKPKAAPEVNPTDGALGETQ